MTEYSTFIKGLLAKVDDMEWICPDDNPNEFITRKGEAFYVYRDEVRYWRDIREPHTSHPPPRTLHELIEILNSKKSTL